MHLHIAKVQNTLHEDIKCKGVQEKSWPGRRSSFHQTWPWSEVAPCTAPLAPGQRQDITSIIIKPFTPETGNQPSHHQANGDLIHALFNQTNQSSPHTFTTQCLFQKKHKQTQKHWLCYTICFCFSLFRGLCQNTWSCWQDLRWSKIHTLLKKYIQFLYL